MMIFMQITFLLTKLWIIGFASADDNCSDFPKTPMGGLCCSIPMIIPKEIANKCEKIVKYEADKIIVNELAMSECVFNESGVVKDGKISLNDVKEKIKPALADLPDLEKVIHMSLDKCVALGEKEADANKKKLSQPPFKLNNVNPLYVSVIHCAAANIFAECPESLEFKSEGCTLMKSYLKRCGHIFPSPILTAGLVAEPV